MADFGFSKKEKMIIAMNIEKWMKDFPFDFDWTKEDIDIVDKKDLYNWKMGDIIDVSPNRLKLFVKRCNTQSEAKEVARCYNGDFVGKTGSYIVFKYKYFPNPQHFLEIKWSNTETNKTTMTITSYDGALRIYKQLTGNKFPGFEDYGKDIYY